MKIMRPKKAQFHSRFRERMTGRQEMRARLGILVIVAAMLSCAGGTDSGDAGKDGSGGTGGDNSGTGVDGGNGGIGGVGGETVDAGDTAGSGGSGGAANESGDPPGPGDSGGQGSGDGTGGDSGSGATGADGRSDETPDAAATPDGGFSGAGGSGGTPGEGGSGADGGSDETPDAGAIPEGCDGLVLDNDSVPNDYPPTYSAPLDAEENFWQQAEDFRTATGIDGSVSPLVPHSVTWTPDIRVSPGLPIPHDGEMSAEILMLLAEDLMDEWGSFFGTKGLAMENDSSICGGPTCRIEYKQDFCGFAVVSDSYEHNGRIGFTAVVQEGGTFLSRISSAVVPMISVYQDPVLDENEAAGRLVGTTLEYFNIAGQPLSYEVTSETPLRFSETPVIFVHVTDDERLEYHLAYEVFIDTDSLWTGYVDAIDGQLLHFVQNFQT